MNPSGDSVASGALETPPSIPGAAEAAADSMPVCALLLGERLDTRALERITSLGSAPLTLEIPGGGIAVLFRYGAIALFGLVHAEGWVWPLKAAAVMIPVSFLVG